MNPPPVALRRLPIVLIVAGFWIGSAADLSRAQDAGNGLPDHSPQGALWRAAAVPGWGQLYNRQYYKIPIVWAGLGGIAASSIFINNRYLLFRHAYHYVVGADTSAANEADFERLIDLLNISRERGLASAAQFRQSRDNLRRNRDLLYIGIGLFYGLSVLDAYVNAHLLDFDVGEDLTLSLEPAPGGFAAAIRFRP